MSVVLSLNLRIAAYDKSSLKALYATIAVQLYPVYPLAFGRLAAWRQLATLDEFPRTVLLEALHLLIHCVAPTRSVPTTCRFCVRRRSWDVRHHAGGRSGCDAVFSSVCGHQELRLVLVEERVGLVRAFRIAVCALREITIWRCMHHRIWVTRYAGRVLTFLRRFRTRRQLRIVLHAVAKLSWAFVALRFHFFVSFFSILRHFNMHRLSIARHTHLAVFERDEFLLLEGEMVPSRDAIEGRDVDVVSLALVITTQMHCGHSTRCDLTITITVLKHIPHKTSPDANFADVRLVSVQGLVRRHVSCENRRREDVMQHHTVQCAKYPKFDVEFGLRKVRAHHA
mmetsp:Transcript_37891/g.86714  ORF Transcript_37891/g.86714 Transcript_37891/m.86714 type:complete len:340 (-) Transcript_37891:793-1812(-)